MVGQVVELLAWFAALEAGEIDPDHLKATAETESVPIDPAASDLDSAEQQQDAQVALDQV